MEDEPYGEIYGKSSGGNLDIIHDGGWLTSGEEGDGELSKGGIYPPHLM